MKNKVYCTNCKYFGIRTIKAGQIDVTDVASDWQREENQICTNEKFVEYRNTAVDRVPVYQHPRDINRNNDCKEYKHSWWRAVLRW